MRHIIILIIVLSCISCTQSEKRAAVNAPERTEMAITDLDVAFWQWFCSNVERFNRFEDDQEHLMDQIIEQLRLIDENLVCEISSAVTGNRELVVSADGIKESFPSVVELTNAAPEIPGWTVTAFRPRMDVTQFTLQYDGRKLAAKDFYFSLQSKDEEITLFLYVPGLTDESRNDFVNASYVLLDMAIGEYDVTTKIGYIVHRVLPHDPESEGLLPLTELPREFDELHVKLNQSGA